MKDDEFVETVGVTSKNDKDLFPTSFDDEEEDDSFIPDSLKGFLEAADAKLRADLDDVLKSGSKGVPKEANFQDSYDEDEDADVGTRDMLSDMMRAEQAVSAAAKQQQEPSLNPAANLTAAQAEDDAMEGMSFDFPATRLEYPNEPESNPPSTPSVEEKTALSSNQQNETKVVQQQVTPEHERSNISSSSSSHNGAMKQRQKQQQQSHQEQQQPMKENDERTPESPPAIVYTHQQPEPEVPSSSELLQQALDMQQEVEETFFSPPDPTTLQNPSKQSTRLSGSPQRRQQQQKQNLPPKNASTPPPKPSPPPQSSPSGTVGNLLEYLHPTNNNSNKSRQPQNRPQQLFKGDGPRQPPPPPPRQPPPPIVKPNTPMSEISSISTPTKALRAMRQQQMKMSPMSQGSPARQQGQSPITSPGPRRQLTAPDANIPSRLLQQTRASQAKENMANNKAATRRPKKPQEQPTSRRLSFMKPTQASSRHTARSKLETSAHDKLEHDRKAADKTAKARIRARMESTKHKTPSAPQPRRPPPPKVKSSLDKVRERKERLERMEQERLAKLKAKIEERDQKAKERRERLALEKKLASPPPTVAAEQQQRKRNARKSIVPRAPTIPVAPKFRTDERLKAKKEDTKKQDPIPLARASDVLMRSFREDQSATTTSGTGERKLTIPKTPKFVTTKKYGDKGSSVGGDHDDSGSVDQWQSGLRSVSSPSNWSANSGLTIPKTPHFQPARKRELPKSTAELEQEQMDYQKAHPFKARPVEMNKRSTASATTTANKPRKPTVPKPFRLSASTTASAKAKSAEKKEEDEKKPIPFKAKPAPSFPAPRGTPVGGFTMRTKRPVTTPAPFQFSEIRRSSKPPPPDAEPSEETKFRARPMPKFDKPSIPIQSRNPNKLRSPPAVKQDVSVKSLRARPVPKCLSQPSTIPVRTRDPTKLRSPDYVKASPDYAIRNLHRPSPPRFNAPPSPVVVKQDDETDEVVKPFRAKPVPRFLSQPSSIPVRTRDPTKLRSPDYVKDSPSRLEADPPPAEKQDENDVKPFRAKPVPKCLSQPSSIPVRTRDPTKLRSPDYVKDSPSRLKANAPSAENQDETDVKPFRAKPAPKCLSKPASIPVRTRDPAKLRSPDYVKDSPNRKEANPPPAAEKQDETDVKPFRAKPVPKSLSKPSPIPVRTRDPTKLRSPDYVKDSPRRLEANSPSVADKQDEPDVEPFRAKPIPKSVSKPSSIPVRTRDPTKLRSPDYVKASPEYASRNDHRSSLSPPRGLEKVKPGLPKSATEGPMPDRDSMQNSPSRESSTSVHARPAPHRSPPKIPVRHHNPLKLRPSPQDAPEQNLPKPASMAESSTTSSVLKPRVDRKKVPRESLRQRMRGKAGTKQQQQREATDESLGVGSGVVEAGTASSDSTQAENSKATNGRLQKKDVIAQADATLQEATQKLEKLGEVKDKSSLLAAMGMWPQAEPSQTTRVATQAESTLQEGNQKSKQVGDDLPGTSSLHAAMNLWPQEGASGSKTPDAKGWRGSTSESGVVSQADATLQEANQTLKEQGDANGIGEAPSSNAETIVDAKGSRDSTSDLRVAMDGWMCSALATTPISKNAPRGKSSRAKAANKTNNISETRRLEQEAFMVHDPSGLTQGQSRSQLFEETTRLAADLQRAVEDELSFEASLNAKDNLDEGFIGQPAHSL
eukprot:scaffold305_cov110-Cylindrotheca_fusiformis.AAC.27